MWRLSGWTKRAFIKQLRFPQTLFRAIFLNPIALLSREPAAYFRVNTSSLHRSSYLVFQLSYGWVSHLQDVVAVQIGSAHNDPRQHEGQTKTHAAAPGARRRANQGGGLHILRERRRECIIITCICTLKKIHKEVKCTFCSKGSLCKIVHTWRGGRGGRRGWDEGGGRGRHLLYSR